ncbi:hypothetical protein R3I94_003626 [Phoxinus phoxinus]
MDFFRQYFWAALLMVTILVSVVIVVIFIFINICIGKRAAWYSTQAKANHYDGTNLKKQDCQVYHINSENEKPPLPPRDQFMSMDSVDQSYEEVEPVPDYVVVEESPPPGPHQPVFTPQYTTVRKKSQDQDSEEYDDVEIPTNCDSDDYDDVG